MATSRETKVSTFATVFAAEAEVIAARRQAVADGLLAADRSRAAGEPAAAAAPSILAPAAAAQAVHLETGLGVDERGHPIARPVASHGLTGLALSGGGIRSAAFCLGVLQGLDAVRPDAEPQVFDRIDYLSTVSGGGYMGVSLVSATMQAQGRFPFASKLDGAETLETQHLRDNANYLLPRGGFDVLVGILAVFRGLVVNATVFLCVVLSAAAFTVWAFPEQALLARPLSWPGLVPAFGAAFPLTILGALALTSAIPVSMLIVRVSHWLTKARPSLRTRERTGVGWTVAWMVLALIAACELQPYALAGVFALGDPRPPPPDTHGSGNLFASAIGTAADWLARGWYVVLTGAAALVASAGKLLSTVRATLGDQTWIGSGKRWAGLIGLGLLAILPPLAIWSSYLAFAYWGIADDRHPVLGYAHTPDWLVGLGTHAVERGGQRIIVGHFGWLYLGAAGLTFLLSILVRPNAGSLHGYYRDRLSRAFLWSREELVKAARRTGVIRGRDDLEVDLAEVDGVDRYRFSSLKVKEAGGWRADARFAPYLLVNAAVNLGGSRYLNRRGRNADNFVFSPLYAGSEATGYATMTALEDADPNLNLATAMAASGAAVSANMGASTIKLLTFSLSVLNVRLGYWLPNPRYAATWRQEPPYAAIGPIYFAIETFGATAETYRNVYVTDGGHFDNLGLYELLKRRCRVIVVADAEADPAMNFESLVRLERYARIDLGVRLDLPIEALRRSALAITAGTPHGPFDEARRCHGPHVAVGRILYGEERGVLIYVKASLSGDESDLIRDYKRREPAFPHETTLDQFFGEEQFEVYRALGFHATHSFFGGADRFATLDADTDPDWLDDLDAALRHLNVPSVARTRILSRAAIAPHPA